MVQRAAHCVIELVGQNPAQHSAQRRVAHPAIGCVFDFGQHAADGIATNLAIGEHPAVHYRGGAQD